MINGTNLLAKDNPRWPIGNAAETMKAVDDTLLLSRASAVPSTAISIRSGTRDAERAPDAGA